MKNLPPYRTTKATGTLARWLTAVLMLMAGSAIAPAAVTNTVTVNGTSSLDGSTLSTSANASVDVQNANPSVTFTKAGTLDLGGNGTSNAGDLVTYTFTIKNTGNVTLDTVSVTDLLPGLSSPALLSGDTNNNSALDPDLPGTPANEAETWTYQATYAITQNDINAGTIANTAQFTATPRSGGSLAKSATTSVPVPASATITLAKVGSFDPGTNGIANPGDVITYAFRVENAGQTTLTNVKVTDPGATITGGPIVLAPGAVDTTSFVGTYAITQADIDNAADTNSNLADADRLNTATVKANSGAVALTPVTAQTTTSIPRTGSMTFAKQVTSTSFGAGVPHKGDTISYSFVVTNTGNTTLSGVSINDPLVMSQLDTGNERFFAMLDAARLNADPIQTASIDQVHSEPEPTSHGEVPTLPSGLVASQRLIYLAGDAAAPKLGDRIGVVVTVTNTGETPLLQITADILDAQSFSDTIPYLAPGETNSSSLIFVHQLNEEDLALGTIRTQANLEGQSRNQILTSVSVGELPLNESTSFDDLVTAVITPNNVATLAPGATTTFTATYSLTQANIDAGTLTNNATAKATAPTGLLSLPASATVTLPPDPRIAVVKTATPNFGTGSIPNFGETVTWTFTVTNPGNVTLSSVSLADTLLGLAVPARISGDTNSNNKLEPSETWTYTANYALTQADIDAGQLDNQATVSGTPPSGAPVSDLSDESDPAGNDITSLSLAAQPKMALAKTAGAPTVNLGTSATAVDAGDTISYTFTLANMGNVSLSGVSVTDPLPGLSTLSAPTGDGGTANVLDAGESWTYTATLTLAQADIDAGQVQNQATAKATPPIGAAITDLSDNILPATNPALQRPTLVTLPQQKGITLLKSVSSITDVNGNGLLELGDTINYQFTVTNTGTVTLAPVTVSDSNATVSGTIAALAPGTTDSTTITATHVVTAIDVTARKVTNQATASGKPPTGPNVTDKSDPSNPAGNAKTVTKVSEVKISLVKAFAGFTDVNSNGAVDEGDLINYTFSVVNTGTEPLTTINLTDPLPGISAITFDSGDANANNAIDADDATTSGNERESWIYKASYTINAADITASKVTNQATVSATGPGGTVVSDLSDPTSLASNRTTVTPVGDPHVALIKTAGAVQDANHNGMTDAGDTIAYAFTVSNTGPIPLTNIRVTDPKATVTGGPLATLAVGAVDKTTFKATYTIKTSDIETGGVTNQATVFAGSSRGTAADKSDDNDNAQDDATFTPLTSAPAIALVKTIKSVSDTNGDGINDVGDTINYVFAVTNTGNVNLTNIKVTDPNAVVKGGTLANLKPGVTDSRTFTATHLITGADAVVGKVVNQAKAAGRAAGTTGIVVSDVSDDKTTNGNNPTVLKVFRTPPNVSKVASKSEIRRGESVGYTITASDLTGFNVAIRDVMPGSFIYETGSASVDGKSVTPKIEGRNLTFTGLKPDTLGKIVIKLRMVAGATLTTGRYTNVAEVINRDNGAVIATASATVTLIPEHVFDCGDVIGRVFDDRNSNGYADDGELGLAGVKVVTVNGLIITSDSEGRFHVACADIPNAEIGSNFIMKLDPTTLPEGYILTTENPRDVRLTRGKVTKLNFGASHSCDVNLAVRKDAFVPNGTALNVKWTKDLGRLTSVLKQCPGKLSITYQCGQYAPIADDRLAALEAAIRNKWDEDGAPYQLPINSRVECGK
jgi:uncharacterized repeat protein (TIGR01451 family)